MNILETLSLIKVQDYLSLVCLILCRFIYLNPKMGTYSH